jgi:hypothetical protein
MKRDSWCYMEKRGRPALNIQFCWVVPTTYGAGVRVGTWVRKLGFVGLVIFQIHILGCQIVPTRHRPPVWWGWRGIVLSLYTRAVQWETGKVVIKIACTTNIVVGRVCKGGDLELPIDGIGTPAARIGTWETVQQDGGAHATVHNARTAKCCDIFV